ncbi:hypothetical protein VTN31DRAFT_1864 [Thermomyces dupontii]|uniref:uncharacterized protein n=1 Tax=Talaromyces thermophilus TaxID=28565 RepID=UPI0037421872
MQPAALMPTFSCRTVERPKSRPSSLSLMRGEENPLTAGLTFLPLYTVHVHNDGLRQTRVSRATASSTLMK